MDNRMYLITCSTNIYVLYFRACLISNARHKLHSASDTEKSAEGER